MSLEKYIVAISMLPLSLSLCFCCFIHSILQVQTANYVHDTKVKDMLFGQIDRVSFGEYTVYMHDHPTKSIII